MTMCTIYLLGRNILAFGITSLRLPFVHSFQEKGKVIHYRVSTESEVRWGVSAPERLSWLRVPAWPRGMAPGHPPCSPTPSARMLALFHAPPPTSVPRSDPQTPCSQKVLLISPQGLFSIFRRLGLSAAFSSAGQFPFVFYYKMEIY